MKHLIRTVAILSAFAAGATIGFLAGWRACNDEWVAALKSLGGGW